ncbi:hypothetical protein BDM02DRAFT_3117563 [Thelephora ganbajun]|uniref:Uncharacterized protein n=1 Tax=Thelephora ganbajun TaxID=370292 RepID=A0ACB6ZBW2_THEGA|nr:hypothetical protein BDM02DRAFT_3117563 [Thelephora ganbajun]
MASHSNLRVGMDLESCTAEVQPADEFTLDGQLVILIDTPGFDYTSKSDTEILNLIAAFLATTYEAGSKLAGVIYIHRISDKRFTGIAERSLKMFRELCGDSTLKNVILVTNMWEVVAKDVGEARERELVTNFFKPVLDKGAQLARHRNTTESAHGIIRRIMRNHPITLQIQRELVDDHKDITDTVAGKAINKEFNEQIRRHQAELKAIQEETLKARNEKDKETMWELEEETRKLQEQMKKMRMGSEHVVSNYQEEKRRAEEVMRQMQEQARQESETVLVSPYDNLLRQTPQTPCLMAQPVIPTTVTTAPQWRLSFLMLSHTRQTENSVAIRTTSGSKKNWNVRQS